MDIQYDCVQRRLLICICYVSNKCGSGLSEVTVWFEDHSLEPQTGDGLHLRIYYSFSSGAGTGLFATFDKQVRIAHQRH